MKCIPHVRAAGSWRNLYCREAFGLQAEQQCRWSDRNYPLLPPPLSLRKVILLIVLPLASSVNRGETPITDQTLQHLKKLEISVLDGTPLQMGDHIKYKADTCMVESIMYVYFLIFGKHIRISEKQGTLLNSYQLLCLLALAHQCY